MMSPTEYQESRKFLFKVVRVTTVILTLGARNPGSVLLGVTPFPKDPLDPPESSSELGRPISKYPSCSFDTFGRKTSNHLDPYL